MKPLTTSNFERLKFSAPADDQCENAFLVQRWAENLTWPTVTQPKIKTIRYNPFKKWHSADLLFYIVLISLINEYTSCNISEWYFENAHFESALRIDNVFPCIGCTLPNSSDFLPQMPQWCSFSGHIWRTSTSRSDWMGDSHKLRSVIWSGDFNIFSTCLNLQDDPNMFCCFSGWNHQQCAEWFRLKKMGAGLNGSETPWWNHGAVGKSVLDVLNGKDGLVSRLGWKCRDIRLGWKWIWDLMRHHGKSREDDKFIKCRMAVSMAIDSINST